MPFYTHPLQQCWKGGILVSPYPSICLWTELCPLCIFNNTCRIHFIFTHLIKQLRKVCNVFCLFFVLPLHRRWNGGILDSPRCPSVRPSVPPSLLPSVHPSVCRQGFRNFLKKLLAQFISYLAFTLMGWVSWPLYIFMFLASLSALGWPNIWPKMGFPELFEKTIGPIRFTWHLPLWGESLDPYTFSCS